VRAAHLTDYAWQDRAGTGQPDQFKAAAEMDALHGDLSTHPSDVLILRGLGSAASLTRLREELAEKGHLYNSFYVQGPTVYAGIGFLLRESPSETIELSRQNFRIREQQFQPLAGAVRAGGIWFWNAEMPDLTQSYERRRNEARILAQNIRPQIDAGEAVLLSLHSREESGSPMIRMLEEAGLRRILAKDDRGDGWTQRDTEGVHYRMDQWLFGSPALLERLEEAGVLERPEIRAAGRYRHQILKLNAGR